MFASPLILVLLATTAQTGPEAVVEPSAKLEKLWDQGSFTESGTEAADGLILISDIGARIMRFDPKTGATTVFREPSGQANGKIFDAEGRLAVEGSHPAGDRGPRKLKSPARKTRKRDVANPNLNP